MPRRNNSFKSKQFPQQKKASRNQKKTLFLETNEQSVVKVEQPGIKKKFTQHDINRIKPLTNNQMEPYRDWETDRKSVV